MTTIVGDFKGNVIASDSMVTCQNRSYLSSKIFKAADGSVVAICGDLDDGQAFFEWYDAGMDEDEEPEIHGKEDPFEALVLTGEGLFHCTSRLKMSRVENGHFAIGSGAEYALGAFAAGASASQAVEIACGLDRFSAQPVVCMGFSDEGSNPKSAARRKSPKKG